MLVPYDIGDYTCRRGAEAIADAVRAYWTAQGYLGVQAWVVFESGPRNIVWGVRSNLVNGLPPL